MTTREQIAFMADMFGIITGLMAIIGVGGILTWGKLIGFRDERLQTIYGYLAVFWRCSLAILAVFFFFFLGDRLSFWIFTMVFNAFEAWAHDLYLNNFEMVWNISYWVGVFVAVIVFMPVAIVVCHCLIVGSLNPAKHFFNFFRASNYKP